MHRIHRIIPRMYSTLTQTPSTPILEKLQDRAIIRLRGVDAAPFLQGLITNDMQHLVRGASSMYTMFLNKQGRVLYDAIVYNEFSTNDFMIECDSKVVDDLCGHLKLYRIRKKITVEKETDQDVWALFQPEINIEKSLTKDVKSTENIQCYVDPRMKYLGTRIIVPKDFSAIENELQNTKITKGSGSDYREHRYRLGVGEGISDLPPEKCFPLEANCDYMHGVSFHKGCYLGQELTARTYHTGIIRKRLMPLDLLSTIQVNDDTKVILPDGKNVGKVRGVQGCVGLALLRIEQVLKADDLTVNQIKCSTLRPHWWPEEAPTQIIKK